MSTKKDLVEAHAFSRRRLVTAFVSGAPGGREVEPSRPGRVIIGGIALTVLLLAGAAIAGFLLGRPNSAWLEAGSFVISKDTGEQYVILRGDGDAESAVIQRVPNYLSAQLLLGEAELTPFSVKDSYIRDVTLGPDLGIESAPSGLPATADLIDSGWTACTLDGAGVKLSLPTGPVAEPRSDGAFVVRTAQGGPLWLVASSPGVGGEEVGRAYRFALPEDPTVLSTLLDRLGFGTPDQAAVVDAAWLDLFPLGPALEAGQFGVERVGERPGYAVEGVDIGGFRVGDLLQTEGGSYLLGDDGPQRLQPFAELLYGTVASPAQPVAGRPAATFDVADYPAEWPSAVPQALVGGDLCGVLEPGADGDEPAITLATAADPDASAAEVGAGGFLTEVDPSGGAYVQVGSDAGADSGTPYVVDAKGSKYPLIGPDVASYIGYGSVRAPLVPDAWMEFFDDPGVTLSINAARRISENASGA